MRRDMCALQHCGYASTRSDDAELRKELTALANQRRRFGYRRLHLLPRRRGTGLKRLEVFQQGVHPIVVLRQHLVAVDRAVMAGVGVAGQAGVEC